MYESFLLNSRSSFSLDLISCSMLIAVLLQLCSVYFVRVRQNYRLHKRLQSLLSFALFALLIVFEIDIRLNGWQHQAKQSPYFAGVLFPMLYVHILIAVATACFWSATFWLAWKRAPNPPQPGGFSFQHRRMARLSVMLLFATTCTGWLFYWMAFIAS